jgi:predicted ferric reductase
MILATTSLSVWYAMRATGLVSLILFSLTVALGVVGVKRWQSSRWSRLVTSGLHRNLSLLATAFVAVHVVTAVADSYIGLDWLGILVPFRSAYRPLAVGMGVVAFDLVLAVMATSLLRRHLAHRTWRLVHWLTWVLWPVAVLHAVGAGTDRLHVGLWVTLACVALVGAAAVWRLQPVRPVRPARPDPVAGRLASGRPPVTFTPPVRPSSSPEPALTRSAP